MAGMDTRVGESLAAVGADVAHGWRIVRRRPGFALAVVLTLGMGIGANTAVFGLIQAVVLSPLPYEDPDELYAVFERHTSGRMRIPSHPTFRDLAAGAEGLDGLAFTRGAPLTYRAEGHSGILLGAFVTEAFFDVLGVPAELGRVLTGEDHRPEAGGAVVLSHRAWTRWFGSDPDVLGTTLRVDELSFVVVGVMPSTFAFPDWGADNDLWMPISHLPLSELAALEQRGFSADSRVVARVAGGQDHSVAQRSLDRLAEVLAQVHPDVSAGWTTARLEPLRELEVRGVRARLFVLWAAVLLLLLMCCLNLANLYVVQGRSRAREYALRAALGAPRGRVFRQVVTETLALALAGGGAGALLAGRVLAWAGSGGLADLPRIAEVRLDGPVLAFVAALSVATAVVFALASTRHAGSASLHADLRGAGRGATRTTSVLSAIQAVQVGTTFVLLLGAWLLGETFLRLARVDPGYEPANLLVVPVNPPSPAYDEEEAAVGLYARLMERLRAVPGVTAVALANHGPGGLRGAPTPAAVGRAPEDADQDLSVFYRTVSAGYFATVGTRVLAGREFTEDDLRGGEGPVVVNETLAARLGGPAAAVGRTIGVRKAASSRADFGEPLLGTVVGVVADLDASETGGEPTPFVYVPFTHTPWAQVRLLVRTGSRSTATVQIVEEAVRSVEPRVPVVGSVRERATDRGAARLAACAGAAQRRPRRRVRCGRARAGVHRHVRRRLVRRDAPHPRDGRAHGPRGRARARSGRHCA